MTLVHLAGLYPRGEDNWFSFPFPSILPFTQMSFSLKGRGMTYTQYSLAPFAPSTSAQQLLHLHLRAMRLQVKGNMSTEPIAVMLVLFTAYWCTFPGHLLTSCTMTMVRPSDMT